MIVGRSQDFNSGLSSDPSIYYLLTVPGSILGRINVLMKSMYQGDIISLSCVILIVCSPCLNLFSFLENVANNYHRELREFKEETY